MTFVWTARRSILGQHPVRKWQLGPEFDAAIAATGADPFLIQYIS